MWKDLFHDLTFDLFRSNTPVRPTKTAEYKKAEQDLVSAIREYRKEIRALTQRINDKK